MHKKTALAIAVIAFYMMYKKKKRLKIKPPIAQQRYHEVLFGVVAGEDRGPNAFSPPRRRPDPWFWLRDMKRKNKAMLAHLRRENAYTEQQTAHLAGFRKVLYDEHISHLKETDDKPASIDGDYFYYTRTEKGLGYIKHCRKPRISKQERLPSPEAKEEVYLDENEVAKDHKHCTIKSVKISADHNLVAYTADFTGSETYEIRVHDIANGKDLPDVVTKVGSSLEWGKNSLFYFIKDKSERPYKLMYHALGTPQENDICLKTEEDVQFWSWMWKSKSNRFLFVCSGSSETHEIQYIDLASKGEPKLIMIQKRILGLIYLVAHNGRDDLLIWTNKDGALNQRLMIAPLDNPGQANWKELIPYDSNRRIDSVEEFENFLVIQGREGGLSQLWIIDAPQGQVDANSLRRVKFKEELYDVSISVNKVFKTPYVRITYSSLTTPTTWYDCEMSKIPKILSDADHQKAFSLIKQTEILNFDHNKYICKRLFAKASDGTRIPMSVVCLKSCLEDSNVENKDASITQKLAKPRPMMMCGYGSYGCSIEPKFKNIILPYLDRGVIYVIAHIRGGGAMGRFWYEEQGKYLNKRNTFSDFIACAEHLIESGWTSPSLMACEGRSAGGLLIGNVVNMRPDLFQIAVASVPFVDLMNTMSDPSIPLTTNEWSEWGNPNCHKYFDYMLSYSPYDNVRKQGYPNIYVSTGLHDPRVGYWEPAKWVSKLRFNKTDQNEILFKVDMDAGHFSASERYKLYRERSHEQAFVLDKLGICAREIGSSQAKKSKI